MVTQHDFPAISIHNLEEFLASVVPTSDEYIQKRAVEFKAIRPKDKFRIRGYCYYCGKRSEFTVDFLYANGETNSGKPIPNWRERLLCKKCNLNNRMRACIHYLERSCHATPDSRIYITEQSTSLYEALKSRYPHLTGSEFFGDKVPLGEIDPLTGYRNENIAKLSFADASLDYALTFDVLEHVPNYVKALGEFYRVLRPGGHLIFTVPFAPNLEHNIVRAEETAENQIIYHMEPQYHGDPINDHGCLSFYTFSWQLLNELSELGFVDVKASYYWSDTYAYLGEHQIIFSAVRE